MSGVIDDNGVQWEHCNECGKWVRYHHLKYEPPSRDHKYGRDLCPECYQKFLDAAEEQYRQARDWRP